MKPPSQAARAAALAALIAAGGARVARGDPVLTVNGVNADYTTSKLFVDELAGESVALHVVLVPGVPGVPGIVAAEVFSNLNRRDFATADANGDGEHDGILPPDGSLVATNDTAHYYRAYTMGNTAPGRYELTLAAAKTGAYRLTARWKTGSPSDPWQWYGASGRRDHAVVVSPPEARRLVVYEVNTLNAEANDKFDDGGSFIERSTFEDLHDAPGAPRTGDGRGFNLDYLAGLGVNCLWFQPIHPPAIERREVDPGTGQPYQPGSPYAVKNFFEVNPWMSAAYTNGTNPADLLAGRPAAMASFTNFVAAADAKGIAVMLDAPFNHTGWDCELAQAGLDLFQPTGATWSATDAIRQREARFYSRANDYGQRAYGADSVAVAPDRFDFGKWADVIDVYFGRYAALVQQYPADATNHLSEADWFDAGDANFAGTDFTGPAGPQNVTRNAWKYFARYALFWLERTGCPPGTPATEATRGRGVDGVRCDFGQGLPPQAWEYIVNVARARKWNFLFMSESLDGGNVTYRSNRHFDLLNENIVFPLKSAAVADDYRAIFENRRTWYGPAAVLLNTVSHDEEHYADFWQALVRYLACGAIDGAPMVGMGQELGVSYTNGFNHYEWNFGKRIPQFKRFNSMEPAWTNRAWSAYGEAFAYEAFAPVGRARASSPALRSPNRYFLSWKSGGSNSDLFAVAKYEEAKASPAFRDVVFAFANLGRNGSPSAAFEVGVVQDGANLFGIRPERRYNVRNLAAYLGADPGRADAWLWGAGQDGSNVLANGLWVQLNPVPATAGGWESAPFEAQYLKLYDVTPPPATGPAAAPKAYAIGTNVTFSWTTAAFGPDDRVTNFVLRVGTAPGGSNVFAGSVGAATNRTVTGAEGQTLYATVVPVSAAGIEGATSPTGTPVILLAAAGDRDGDGMRNGDEDLAGTDPLDSNSVFVVTAVGPAAGPPPRAVTFRTEPGKRYTAWYNDAGIAATGSWQRFANTNLGVGAWVETNAAPSTFTFLDDQTTNTTHGPPPAGIRFYRVGVE